MTGKIINYYAGGNTAKGFYSLFDSALKGLNRLYILKGGPGTGKSFLMKSIAREMVNRGYDIQQIHCASDNQSIDGVIINSLKFGIVDGTAPHVLEPNLPGIVEEYVNLGVAWDSAKLVEHKKEIKELNEKISRAYQKAYASFAEALKIHDEWERIYIQNMDFVAANKTTEDLIKTIFQDQRVNKSPDVRHRFLGAATPEGPNDFINNLTEDIAKRYFIKGRPGSGKSTMLKKIAARAENSGFDVEIYHCGFDPNSLDMVVVRELSVAIFDSTAPHEYDPVRETDEIIDMYEKAISPGTDEKYAAELKEIANRYRKNMNAGTGYLAEAKSLRDQLESYYKNAMDFNKVDQIRNEIQAEIDRVTQFTAAD